MLLMTLVLIPTLLADAQNNPKCIAICLGFATYTSCISKQPKIVLLVSALDRWVSLYVGVAPPRLGLFPR